MLSHSFDSISGALGLIAAAVGALVAFGGVESIDTGWWLALGALVLGVGLVPWTRSRRPVADGDADPTTGEGSEPPRLRL